MNIIRHWWHAPQSARGSVLALGNFDGVHLGHQAIFKECVVLAKAAGTEPAALTFEPHPREFFAHSHAPMRLYSFRQKVAAIEAAGIKNLFVVRFDERFASLSADQFVSHVLYECLQAKHVVTGYNFHFGKNRQGDTDFLAHKARELNFGFIAHPEVMTSAGEAISSSRIRALLSEGKIEDAGAMLGRPYAIDGRVTRGKQRGKNMGFPTINLSLARRFKPRFGVYAGRVRLSKDKKPYDAAINIGLNPTFSLTEPVLEAHCLDLSRDVYGAYAEVELLSFLRDEKKFPSVKALQEQIAKDCETVKGLLHGT